MAKNLSFVNDSVKTFYSNHGYCQCGDTFTEAGILHVEMTKYIERRI